MIPFALPDVGEEEAQAVAEVVRKGWLTSGQEMRSFEEELRQYVGSERHECVSVNSATAGLHLALLALGIGPGDRVLVPTLTFAATAEVVKAVGAEPVLCDVDPFTLCMTPETADQRYTRAVKAAIPVSFAGYPLDFRAWKQWADRHGVALIEDAAHSFGAMFAGSRTGDNLVFDATVFSFYATKCITTGEGGAVMTPCAALADRMRVLRLHGISRDVFDRYTSTKNDWEYDVVLPGWKYNMTDMAAAVGRVQLRKADQMMRVRQKIAQQYRSRVAALHQKDHSGHAAHLHVIHGLSDRGAFVNLMNGMGVKCSVHFKPLHVTSAYRDDPHMYPVAHKYWQGCASLPIYSAMTEEQVEEVIKCANLSIEHLYEAR